MIKKITLLAMAVGAIAALVAPGVASATKLTMPNGTLVPVGTAITGTANNTTVPLRMETETYGTIECESIMLNGEVTKNNGTTAEGKGTAGSTTSGCSLEGESPVTISEIEIINVSSTEVGAETGTGKFSAKFAATTPNVREPCKFNTNGENGVFHFVPQTDTLIITPTNLGSVGGCGTMILTGEVTLETAAPGSGPVIAS